MRVVDQNMAEVVTQRARFSPLRMVAKALGAKGLAAKDLAAWSEADASEAPPPARTAPILPMFEKTADEPAPEASGESFLAIVNAMLAGDDAAGMEPDDGAFDLATLIAEAHDVFAGVAQAKGVTLALAIAPDAHGFYQGDVLRLRQAVLNLLSGALKATAEDVLEFTAAWDAGVLTLRVDGAEVAAAMTRVLTEKARPSARRPVAYRLALSEAAMRAMGGAVRASGDSVEMILPLARLADVRPVVTTTPLEDVAIAPVSPAPATPVFAPGLRVLVAEESLAHQQVLRTLLGDMGLDAVVVGEGQELVSAWRQGNWDALLIDIEGETIGGRNLARAIRSAETVARWPRTPLLALAAGVRPRDLDEDFAELIDGLVAKPIHAASLHEAIATALGDAPAVPAARIWAA